MTTYQITLSELEDIEDFESAYDDARACLDEIRHTLSIEVNDETLPYLNELIRDYFKKNS